MLHFDYIEPDTLEDAVSALAGETTGCIIAGGTDVLVRIKDGGLRVDRLVSLSRLAGLRSIALDNGWVSIGAMATMSEIERFSAIRRRAPILCDAVGQVGSVQIRNVATLAGNVCNAAPSADSAPALLALRAQVALSGAAGTREMRIDDFFLGPGRTVLGRDEIVTSIRFPSPGPRGGGAYLKCARRKGMDLPILGIAVQLKMDAGYSRCEEVTVALGLAAPTPTRSKAAERILSGEKLTEETLAQAAEVAAAEATPRDSFRSTAVYRKAMIRNLLPRVAMCALERAKANREER